jgi:hypothetical protein
VRVEELARSLFEPLSPEGHRCTDARTDDLLAEIEREAALLPSFYAARVRRHLHRHRTRWNAHGVMWDGSEVRLRPRGRDRPRSRHRPLVGRGGRRQPAAFAGGTRAQP